MQETKKEMKQSYLLEKNRLKTLMTAISQTGYLGWKQRLDAVTELLQDTSIPSDTRSKLQDLQRRTIFGEKPADTEFTAALEAMKQLFALNPKANS